MGINELLENYKEGSLSLQETLFQLKEQGIEDLGFARIDSDRQARTGIPEVIYTPGKTKEQVRQIAERMYKSGIDILATRASEEVFMHVREVVPEVTFNKMARTIVFHHHSNREETKDYIAIVAAGTSDLPVAEEAAETARFLGNKVERIYDVGVAGIHRLFSKIEGIREARVIIVVAGIEIDFHLFRFVPFRPGGRRRRRIDSTPEVLIRVIRSDRDINLVRRVVPLDRTLRLGQVEIGILSSSFARVPEHVQIDPAGSSPVTQISIDGRGRAFGHLILSQSKTGNHQQNHQNADTPFQHESIPPKNTI